MKVLLDYRGFGNLFHDKHDVFREMYTNKQDSLPLPLPKQKLQYPEMRTAWENIPGLIKAQAS